MGYIGRFAPTPSGPLHLGSLFTALASYLDAKHNQGSWLVRIEDIDQPRCQPGAAAQILRTLEHFGLEWDGPIIYQSERTGLYHQALKTFERRGNLLYPCSCTRKTLRSLPTAAYPGICRPSGDQTIDKNIPDNLAQEADLTRNSLSPNHANPSATRWHLPDETIIFTDRILGHQSYNPASLGGDPILQRKDGLFAYHWAVVVDDEQQGITDVVRGQDLLDQTSIHLSLQQAAKFPQLKYAHLPLITGEDKQKLSKSERASSLSLTHPTKLICRMLVSLGQLTTREATDRTNSPMAAILADAASRWDIEQIPKITSLSAQVLLG